VLAASEFALKAGIQVGRPLLLANGKPILSVQALEQLVASAPGPIALSQGAAAVSLPIQQEALELPLGSEGLCYPAILAHLRLMYAGAKGDAANLLRLNLALAYMQLRKFDRAVELLRETRISAIGGVSQGTVDYYTGVCFLHLGSTYQAEAVQAFRQALKYPQSTLLGPEGPLVAPLAKLALDDLK
jgi:tetratricopeptide (TPR) repeat protein